MILREKLTINGTIRPVAGYTLKTPTGGLGQSLTIALVEPDLSLIPDNAVIKFEIGAGKSDSVGNVTYSYITVIDNGRLNGLSYSAAWVVTEGGGYPNDIIEFTAMSPLSDRLSLAPLAPITLYNPAKVKESDLELPAEALIIDGSGVIQPVLTPVENLNLYQVLDKAYLPCGFSRVITNLPNYNTIDRVDFTLEGGYHSAALPLYTIFEPVVFEADNILYIISPEYGLPPGFTPQALDPLCVMELGRSQETTELANAVIMSYQRDAYGGIGTAGEIPSITILQESPEETGSGESYQRVEVSREITEYKDINTGEIRRVVENWVETSTYAYRPSRNIVTDADGNITVTTGGGDVVLILFEKLSNSYSGFLKSGHYRYVDALYLNPVAAGAPYKYGRVLEETNTIGWQPDLRNPGNYEQIYSQTITSGLCLVESIEVDEVYPPTGKTVKYTHKVYTPILDGGDTGLIVGDGTQGTEYKPLSTVTERLRATGQNQSNVETRITNHLTGTAKPPVIQARPGSRSTYLPPYNVKFSGGTKAGQVREIFKDLDSINLYGMRKAITLDIGKLPPEEGRKIAKRKLKISKKPPRNFEILLPGINFLYRRGLIVTPPLRSGYDNPCIITGLTVSGRALHTDKAVRDMRIEARELVNAGN